VKRAGRYPGDVFAVWPVLALSGLLGRIPAYKRCFLSPLIDFAFLRFSTPPLQA